MSARKRGMLETALASSFEPGSIQRAAYCDGYWGANWLFLMPRLDPERVICIGPPPAAQLATLARHAAHVVVACGDLWQARRVGGLRDRLGLTNLHAVVVDAQGLLPLPGCCADLVFVPGREGTQWIERRDMVGAELRRLLKDEGLIYVDYLGRFEGLLRSTRALGAPAVLRLTPLFGESCTAVPARDQLLLRYFFRHGLNQVSVARRWAAFAMRTLKSCRPLVRPARRGAAAQAGAGAGRRAPACSPQARALALNAVFGFRQAAERAENFLSEKGWIGTRYGAVVGRGAERLMDGPPAYLRRLARQAGVDIEGCRWGLSAPSEYPSRKLVFLLFEGERESPTYVVRMVRDAVFNARLETEWRALARLRESGAVDSETIPQVAFFGYCDGRAALCETAIEGVSLRHAVRDGGGEEYARAIVEWLIELGAATANPARNTAREAAGVLQALFERFLKTYRLAPPHRQFLAGQLAAIAGSRAAFPSVFQHGDCHTGNVMITPAGRPAFIDWERAEPAGVPLWDLFYFLRTYGVEAGRRRGVRDREKSFVEDFLSGSPLTPLIVESVRRYRERLGLAGHLVEPFFYTSLIYFALREATQLSRAELDNALNLRLLKLAIEHRENLRFEI